MGLLDDKETIRYANNSIINPALPLKCKQRQLQLGELIFIRGYVPPKSQTFTINLQMDLGNSKEENILHISVRFKEKVIVRNSHIGGKWGPEERHNGMGALRQNQRFEFCILVHEEYFKVAINRQHFCSYRHRAPYGSINQLHVTGSVQIHSIYSQSPPTDNKLPKMKAMPPLPHITNKAEGDASMNSSERTADNLPDKPFGYDVTMPFKHTIPQGLKKGDALYICGQPTKTAQQFHVILKVGGSLGTRDEVCHLHVTLASPMISCKTQFNGKWGPETRQDQVGMFPFRRGVHFDLLILCQSGVFKISVNNIHLVEHSGFADEINNDLSKVKGLEISGDILLRHVRMS